MRRVLTPRWLALHAFVLLVAVLFCRLGWWQWDRARAAGGGAQNLVYALQWPSFAAFGIYLWWQTVRDALKPVDPDRPTAGPARPARVEPVATAEPEDEELAAYNRYLAELNARYEQQHR